jgi:hypothetical protein
LAKLNNPQYRELLDLLMINDDKEFPNLKTLAKTEAIKRGYTGWVVAYHEVPKNG